MMADKGVTGSASRRRSSGTTVRPWSGSRCCPRRGCSARRGCPSSLLRRTRGRRRWDRHWRGRCDGGAAVAILVRQPDACAHGDDRPPLGGRHPARTFDRLLESVAQVLALGKRALGRAGADRSALGLRELLALPTSKEVGMLDS